MTTRPGVPRLICSLALLASPAFADAAEPEPAEVVITVRRAPARSEPVSSSVQVSQAAGLAGTQGDAAKVLAVLPGVARGGAAGGELIVWGSTPAETRIYLDGVELPVLFHGNGIRSVLPASSLSRLTLLPGAYGVQYGRALGSSVELESRELDPVSPRMELHADLLDAGAQIAAPLSSRWAASAAGRWGYADRWLERFTSRDVGSLISVPSYQDWQLRAGFRPDALERWEATLLGSRDVWRREAPSSDRSSSVRETRDLSFQRLYLRYVRESEDERLELTPFVGLDDSARSGRSGAQGWALGMTTWHYGLRGSQRVRLTPALALRLGIDALGSYSTLQRSGTPTLPAREGDPRVFGQAPGREDARDEYATHVLDVAPQVEAELRWGAWQLTPGVRADTYLLESSRLLPRAGRLPEIGSSQATLVVEPRLAARYALAEHVQLFAAAGVYHQPPGPEDSSAVFGNPRLGLARSLHLSAGERVELTPALSVEVLGYWKRSSQLPARSSLPIPNVAESLVPTGAGSSFGAQLMLRHLPRRGWSGWLSWTVSRSERKDANGAWRLFDQDQPHVVALVATRYLGDWSFGTRWRYASGTPRTRVVGASYDLLSDRYEPRFDVLNGARLPYFLQLDLRADYALDLAAGARLSLYADALNVLGRRNAEDVVYSSDYRQSEYATGLPPLLMLGARLER